MTPERAEEIRRAIWRHHGRVKVGETLTQEEDDEISRFWANLKGPASFYMAVSRMAEGEHLKKENEP